MITGLAIANNPVTLWERFAWNLDWGGPVEGFEKIEVTDRRGSSWRSRITIYGRPDDLRAFFEAGLGRDVTAYGERGTVDFNGQVEFLRLLIPGKAPMRRSLLDEYNRAWVRFRDATDTFARSQVDADTDAIARYGYREYIASGGQMQSSSLADSVAAQIVARKQRVRTVPENLRLGQSMTSGSDRWTLELTCTGYLQTLGWRVYNQTVTSGVQSADLQIADIAASVGQFVSGTKLTPNPLGVTKVYNADMTALSIMDGIAGLGDVYSQPWRLGMDMDRNLIYEPRASAIDLDL